MSEGRLKEYSQAQATDHICSQVIQFCQSECPPKCKLSPNLKRHAEQQYKLTFDHIHDILLYEDRIVVPSSLQQITLDKTHQGQ